MSYKRPEASRPNSASGRILLGGMSWELSAGSFLSGNYYVVPRNTVLAPHSSQPTVAPSDHPRHGTPVERPSQAPVDQMPALRDTWLIRADARGQDAAAKLLLTLTSFAECGHVLTEIDMSAENFLGCKGQPLQVVSDPDPS